MPNIGPTVTNAQHPRALDAFAIPMQVLIVVLRLHFQQYTKSTK